MRRGMKYAIVLIVASSLLFLLDTFNIVDGIGFAIERGIIGPAVSLGNHAANAARSLGNTVIRTKSLPSELARLEEERDYFRGEYFRLKAVEEENMFLRQALEFEGETSSGKLLAARVLSHDPFGVSQSMLIDKGRRDGVRMGEAIIGQGRIFIGTIAEVDAMTSRVLLVTAESSRTPVILQGTGTHAVVAGSPTGALNLELVPREVPLAEGDIVLTSGISGEHPQNLLVGEVRHIIDDETASFKRAVVEPFARMPSVSTVFIIK